MEVIRTQLPSTLIDVSKHEVKQTNQLHKHTAMRKDMITNEQIKDETGFYAKWEKKKKKIMWSRYLCIYFSASLAFFDPWTIILNLFAPFYTRLVVH